MALEKETSSFTDSTGEEHNYDIFTMKSITKYVLVVKQGYPLTTITVLPHSYRVHMPETTLAYYVIRVINEFIAHILSLRSE